MMTSSSYVKIKSDNERYKDMLNTFIFAVNAIFPLILIILLGYFIKKTKIIDQHFVIMLNKYVFRVGLPILLFYNVYRIESFDQINYDVVIYTTIATLLVFLFGMLIVKLLIPDDKQKGVILQCAFRSNYALIGIPLAEQIGGSEALVTVSLLAAVSIPLANLLSVVALTMYQKNEHGDRISGRLMIRSIITNPLIIAVFSGLFVLLIRSFIPESNGKPIFTIKDNLPFLMTTMRLVSQTASPMALIALGAQFEISVIKSLAKQITLGVALRVLIVPGIVIYFAYVFSSKFTGLESSYPALIALYGSPVAVSSSIMTQEMGGDYPLASQLVIWTTTASMITIFITIVLLRSLGLI